MMPRLSSCSSVPTLLIAATIVAALSTPARADEPPFAKGNRTRGLTGGWGHSWRPPLFGETRTRIAFGAFVPRMGWFVTDRVEGYGEATLFLYYKPEMAVAVGPVGLGGRYYLKTGGSWIPYLVGGAGLIWTSLDVPEIDRVFNFQLVGGIGWRQTRARGPRLLVEFRTHHISNAGTAGENLGIDAATLLTGVEWVLRPSP